MEIDLSSIKAELVRSMKPSEPTTATHKEEDHSLPPTSRMKTLDDLTEKPVSAEPINSENSLAKELSELKERYSDDMEQWREYDRRVQEWKKQVQGVFDTLKKEVSLKQQLAADLIESRANIRAKEKEILMLRALIERKEGKEFLENFFRS